MNCCTVTIKKHKKKETNIAIGRFKMNEAEMNQ